MDNAVFGPGSNPRANTLMERMERMEKMYEDLFVKYTILEMNYQQLTRNLSEKALSKYSGSDFKLRWEE